MSITNAELLRFCMCLLLDGTPCAAIQQGRGIRALNQAQSNTTFLVSNICNQPKVCKVNQFVDFSSALMNIFQSIKTPEIHYQS